MHNWLVLIHIRTRSHWVKSVLTSSRAAKLISYTMKKRRAAPLKIQGTNDNLNSGAACDAQSKRHAQLQDTPHTKKTHILEY